MIWKNNILLILLLLHCNYNLCDESWMDVTGDMSWYYFENDIQIETFHKTISWINENIEYVSDIELYGIKEYWPMPDETYDLRAGDCDGKIILLMYLLKQNFNIDSLFICVTIKWSNEDHAITFFKNNFYDLRIGHYPVNIDNYKINYILSYNQILWEAYHYHKHLYCKNI